MADATTEGPVITPDQLLKHWQGHRGLTRRVIDAFPEKDLFSYSIGGMRTMSGYAMEFLSMGVPTLIGVTTGTWPSDDKTEKPTTKADLLKAWDEATSEIERLWPMVPTSRWQETDKAFGQWEMPIHGLILYIIDNEIHHRGQGYVYLRSLGIEPPPFYERG
ncbi:MAG: DinB family protein [Gemmatimonadales bacterium]